MQADRRNSCTACISPPTLGAVPLSPPHAPRLMKLDSHLPLFPGETGRHDVLADIHYYDDPGDGSAPPPVIAGSNQVINERPMAKVQTVIRDVRGEEDRYTLDSHGFQFHEHSSGYGGGDTAAWRDEARVRAEYYPECEQLYKDVTGASRVRVFGHRVRRGPTNWHSLGPGNADRRGPVHGAHVDQSYDGAVTELRFYLPTEADELLKRRFQIINIWRPITTIVKDPLAVASSQSIPDEDLLPAEVRLPSHTKETWTVLSPNRPNRPAGLPRHEWFFKYRQRPDEVLLIKCFDSEETVARRAIHAAFINPETADMDGCRESIELRALIFY
ncbi:hypothetical protein RB601_003032 [Gaeumannomyces tritici]